jgi:hypothetical protein
MGITPLTLEDVDDAAGGIRVDEAAAIVLESNPGLRNLSRPSLTTKLADHLDDLGNPGGANHVTLGQKTSAGVDGDLPAQTRMSLFDEPPAFAFRAEAQVFIVD